MPTAMTDVDSRLARVEVRADGLEDDVREIKADVKQILAIINQGRGAMWMGGLIGSIGGPVVMKALQKMGVM